MKDLENLKEISNAKDITKELFKIRNRNEKDSLKTGFDTLDEKIEFKKGDVIVVASRPGMGKSTFALNIALNVVTKQNEAVTIFNLECSKENVCERIISNVALVEYRSFLNRNLNEIELKKIENVNEELLEKIYIDDTAGINIDEICAKSKKMKLEKDIELIVIDYLQLIQSDIPNQSRDQELVEICRRLKVLAKELNIQIIVLSNLWSFVDRRENKRPMISDFKTSINNIKYFDTIMLLYREGYYYEDHNKELAEIIVDRSGNTIGTFYLRWNSKYMRFEDLSKNLRDKK